jgi:3-deoxy-D-manno-octulosonic-acid transferase
MESVVMGLYSLLLLGVLVLGAPYWLVRMATSGRYRAGLGQRLGRVPAALRAAVIGQQVVWVHAVSVGEVLAATRLVLELETALGEGWSIVVSTTTATGQALARERFGAERVFYYPLDFAWAVRAYLRALQPKLLVLMESEVWPRMLVECRRVGVPTAVVNARVSDRSYARAMKVRAVWGKVLGMVRLFLAQSEEDARRLVAMGARPEAVRAIGNLKYDVRAAGENAMARRLGEMRGASRVIVAGSTLPNEEEMLLSAWPRVLRGAPDIILVIAPRHPERFQEVFWLIEQTGNVAVLGSQLDGMNGNLAGGTVVLLDTIGDLASVYSVASAAFIGGSLVPKGGHNPLEAARFGVPVIMGESFENFRDIVEGLKNAWAIRIIKEGQLADALIEAPRYGQKHGERGRDFCANQLGATGRAVEALVGLVRR